MSHPRRILPGTSYFVTRRCSERRFLLCPDEVVNAVFRFCLAVAAQLTGIQVHAYVVMSNHYHLVVTDPRGVLPNFMAWLNRHTGHCLKLHRARDGDFWESSEKYSAIELTTPEAIWDRLAYVVANPVAAGLVERARDWPGLVSFPDTALVNTIETQRPTLYFRANGPVLPRATLRLSIPTMLQDSYTQAMYVETWKRLVKEREELACRERHGRRVLGAGRVQQTDPYAKPSTTERRRQRNPALAAVTREGLRKSTKALRTFRQLHRAVFQSLKAAADSTLVLEFPRGTWWWVQYGGHKASPT